MIEQDKAVLKLQELLELPVHKLSTWETGFLGDMDGIADMGLSFTEKQLEKIEEIWEKHCGNN